MVVIKPRRLWILVNIMAGRDICCTDDAALCGKGKAILLQAWTGPEVSRRLRLPDFKTVGT
jgi:hypothetical protein